MDDVSAQRQGNERRESPETSSNPFPAFCSAGWRGLWFATLHGSRRSLQICNDAQPVHTELLNTAAAVGEDGWAQIAPFGDFPGVATEVLPGGRIGGKPAQVIQRMDRVAAEAMVAAFNRPWSRVTRWLKGVPIYAGHPDFPGAGHRYPDKTEKGVIASLQVRNDGLYALPVFNRDGQAMIDSKPGLGFSARWTAEPVEVVNGVRILRPSTLISAGLTTEPNLPVELINEAPMDLKALIAALRRLGVTVADDADLATVTTAVVTAADASDAAKASATTQAANERAALTTAQAEIATLRGQLTAARASHAADLINDGIRSGRVTEADRSRLTTEFANDFQSAATALAAKPATALKTAAIVSGATAAAASADIAERRKTSLQMINDLTGKGVPYNDAYAQVLKARPDLFGQAAKS